ncbi:MAG: ATP-binding cassette domain-containing protein [Lachnospiraceae bacterium]|nr:ATP-binding cassette domain-containing protein [Lachnospiraceae bacterium]
MIIKIDDYCKKIRGVNILNNISFIFESGKCYGLKGKNGSGKTMLMRAVCGLIKATSGTISIDGEILGKDISFPRSIGALIENPSFIGQYTGFHNLKILADIQGKIDDNKIRQTLEEIGLEPNDKKTVKKYSLGMKQKLGIAAAFMEEPDIIILDEPINALDEKSVERVKKMISNAKNRGAVLIVACHDTEELNILADEIIYIEEGRITNYEKNVEENYSR